MLLCTAYGDLRQERPLTGQKSISELETRVGWHVQMIPKLTLTIVLLFSKELSPRLLLCKIVLVKIGDYSKSRLSTNTSGDLVFLKQKLVANRLLRINICNAIHLHLCQLNSTTLSTNEKTFSPQLFVQISWIVNCFANSPTDLVRLWLARALSMATVLTGLEIATALDESLILLHVYWTICVHTRVRWSLRSRRWLFLIIWV